MLPRQLINLFLHLYSALMIRISLGWPDPQSFTFTLSSSRSIKRRTNSPVAKHGHCSWAGYVVSSVVQGRDNKVKPSKRTAQPGRWQNNVVTHIYLFTTCTATIRGERRIRRTKRRGTRDKGSEDIRDDKVRHRDEQLSTTVQQRVRWRRRRNPLDLTDRITQSLTCPVVVMPKKG